MNVNLNEATTVEAEAEGGVVEAEVVVEVGVVDGMHEIEVEEVGLRVENDLPVLLQDGMMID